MNRNAIVALVAVTSPLRAQLPAPPGDALPRARAYVEVTDAWVREQPNEDRSTAAYLTLWNNDTVAWVITGVACDDVTSVAIHESRTDGGMDHMTPIERVEVAARTTLRMRPGGVHLMLSGLARPIVRRAVQRGIPCALTLEPRSPMPAARRPPARVIRFHMAARADS